METLAYPSSHDDDRLYTRVSRSGGRLVITTPGRSVWRRWAKVGVGLICMPTFIYGLLPPPRGLLQPAAPWVVIASGTLVGSGRNGPDVRWDDGRHVVRGDL